MRLLNNKDNGEVRLAIWLSINSVWSYCLLGVLLDSSMSRTYLRRIRSEKSTDAVKSNVSGGGDWNLAPAYLSLPVGGLRARFFFVTTPGSTHSTGTDAALRMRQLSDQFPKGCLTRMPFHAALRSVTMR